MSYQPRFRFKQEGSTGGTIFDAGDPIAEVRELRLVNVRLSPHGDLIIGEDVPMPLYWQQYANHQHPERNAGSHGRLECTLDSESNISLKIESASRSQEVRSRYLVDIKYSEDLGSYVFEIQSRLTVPDGKRWLVTHNPSHGELEFCNLWPEGAFVTHIDETTSPRRLASTKGEKRYDACHIQKSDWIERIPHHHLETSDKHDIGLAEGDRFLYLLENQNPVVEMCASESVAAGLCAYMWDAHFAYRVCAEAADVRLPSGSVFDAHFKLYAIGWDEGEKIASAATGRAVPELESIPIYVNGLNTFAESASGEIHGDVWPWEHEPQIPGVIEYARDLDEGHDDNASVRIRAFRPTTGRWMATSLGPAFGEAPFEAGMRFHLSGFVKSRDLDGVARIGLRLHRSGVGDVFDLSSYETYYSVDTVTGSSDWTAIEVTTPVIAPAPDRMHLLLEMDGVGVCWFDDVVFERNV